MKAVFALIRNVGKGSTALGALLALLCSGAVLAQRAPERRLPDLTLRQFRDLSMSDLEPRLMRALERRGYRLIERRQSGASMLLVVRGAPRQVMPGLCELEQLDVTMRTRPMRRLARSTVPSQNILDVPLVVERVTPSKAYHVANARLLNGSIEQDIHGDDCRGHDPVRTPAFAAASVEDARLAANALTAIQRSLGREQTGFPLTCTHDDATCTTLLSTLGHDGLQRVSRRCGPMSAATNLEGPACMILTFYPPPRSIHHAELTIDLGPQARPGAAAIRGLFVAIIAPPVV